VTEWRTRTKSQVQRTKRPAAARLSCRRCWRHLSASVCGGRLPRPCGPRSDKEAEDCHGSRCSVIAHGGPRSVPHGHGREAAVAIFRDAGSGQAPHSGPCARSASWQVPSDGSRVLPVRHVDADGDISPHSAERPLHHGRGDKHSAAMQRDCGRTGQPWWSVFARVSLFRHCARSASWQVPSDGSRAEGPRSRDISQLLSAAEDCHGPAGLAVTKKTEVSQFRHCARRTAVGASWARPRSGCGNLPGPGFEAAPHPRHCAQRTGVDAAEA
jgi:hypothetical protein